MAFTLRTRIRIPYARPLSTNTIEIYFYPSPSVYSRMVSELYLGDALHRYDAWLPPHVIVSDGPYGLGIYPGETQDTTSLASIYEPHIAAWTAAANSNTTLWFWNSELGWAEVHSTLRRYGWVYREATIWDKGIAHIAGKVNSNTVRGTPVTTEICVRYTREPMVGGMHLRDWLRAEWQRSGLPFSKANEACGVKSAATRKWLTNDHLWYAPDQTALDALSRYCAVHGRESDDPYFALSCPIDDLRPRWNHEHGLTNVWQYGAVRGSERIKVGGKTAHPNQKPLALMERCIALSSNIGDVIWEPFGGLCSASVAAKKMGRQYFTSELIEDFYNLANERLTIT